MSQIYNRFVQYFKDNLKPFPLARIVFSVTNDIATDNRILRITKSLAKQGQKITILGRKRKNSLPLNIGWAKTVRFRLMFHKGPLFYAFINLRLFLYLYFSGFDVFVANDLDTLPANFLAARLKRKKLVYDSHEYFTEVPELVARKRIKHIWELIEKRIVPKIAYASTVCYSIAMAYQEKYHVPFEVIRNAAEFREKPDNDKGESSEKKIIYQGVLNIGRGIELAIDAMEHLENIKLLIIGDGDIVNELKQRVKNRKLEEKIKFTGRKSREEVYVYTRQASLGISLEENLGLNYYYALPNKLFDYIQARIPVIVSDLPEMKEIVEHYRIGGILTERTPEALAEKIKQMLQNDETVKFWKTNLDKAARELNWENEERKLLNFYERILK
jgi:glycosyltransferase involved in cell wall biosynthesis